MLKLKPKQQTRSYELTVLTPGDFTSTELKKTLEAIEALVGKLGGKVEATTDWGKRELAYVIKKQAKKYHEAVYTHMMIVLSAQKLSDLNQQLILNSDIIRYLLVVSSDQEPTVLPDMRPRTKR